MDRSLDRRQLLIGGLALGLLPVAGAVLPRTARADDRPTPDGPWVQENQPIRLNGLHSNEELYAELQRLDRQRGIGLDQVGTSLGGRPLYLATVGTGAAKLMIVTQQHGDEPLGTEAALQLLRAASGNDPAAQALRSAVTLYVMPRTNPDGWQRYQELDYDKEGNDWIGGVDPRRNDANQDLNRFYGPAKPTAPGDVPEAFAVNQVVDQVGPALVLDYHHQVSYQTADDDLVTMSVLWSTVLPEDAPQVVAGKRAAVVMDRSLAQYGHAELTLYPRSTNPVVARNGLATAQGVGTLLIEQRGQQDVGQKGAGALIREALLSMQGVASAMADGTFDDVDPALAELIQERGTRVRAPWDSE